MNDEKFVKLKSNADFIDDSYIYYLYPYVSSRKKDDLEIGEVSYASFMCLKNHMALSKCTECDPKYRSKCAIASYVKDNGYNSKRLNFVAALGNALKDHLQVKGAWHVACIPGHRAGDKNTNPCNAVVSYTLKKYDDIKNVFFDVSRNLILRSKEVVDNHNAKNEGKERRDFGENFESITISSPEFVKGKKFILLDDITTTGASLLATRAFLIANGAERVIMLAMGKTI